MGSKKKNRRQPVPESGLNNPFGGLSALAGALPSKPVAEPAAPAPAAAPRGPRYDQMKVVLRRQRAGRGGKTVTRVEGLALRAEEQKALAKRLKKKLGCGCTIEGSDLILLGDLEDRAAAFFTGLGVQKVVLGSR